MGSLSGWAITGSSTAVGAALTDLLGSSGAVIGNELAGGIVNLEIQNTGVNAFTDFVVRLKDHASGSFYDYLLAADFTSSTNANMLFASVAPGTLAGGATAHVIFRCHAAYAIQVQAKRTSATTAVILGNGREI